MRGPEKELLKCLVGHRGYRAGAAGSDLIVHFESLSFEISSGWTTTLRVLQLTRTTLDSSSQTQLLIAMYSPAG